MATDYLTSTELKTALSLTGETFADTDISQAITAASRAVESECGGRRFDKDSSDTTRYYTPISEEFVWIDDLSAVPTSVTNQGTALVAGTDYALSPANAVLDGVPFDSLYNYGTLLFPRGVPNSIVVVGKFGWPAIPAQIKSAATILAARLLRRAREAAFGVIGFGLEGEAVRIASADPDVRLLLAPFKRSVSPT